MKFLNLFFVCFFPLISVCQVKKDFEGKISYDIVCKSKDTSNVGDFLGKEAIIYVKKGDYRQDYPYSKDLKRVIYHQNENKYYYIFRTGDIYVRDCSLVDDTLISIIKNDSSVTIIGYKCKTITITSKKGKSIYYYCEDLHKSSDLFENHNYGLYNVYLKETQSIYLKVEIIDDKTDFIMTAKDLKKRSIKDDEFGL